MTIADFLFFMNLLVNLQSNILQNLQYVSWFVWKFQYVTTYKCKFSVVHLLTDVRVRIAYVSLPRASIGVYNICVCLYCICAWCFEIYIYNIFILYIEQHCVAYNHYRLFIINLTMAWLTNMYIFSKCIYN